MTKVDPSIWEADTFYRKRNIIIIGSGFTGLWSAISIKEKFPDKDILIVERNPIPTGASTRNAGFSCFGSFTEIVSDAETMGWEKTLELVRLRFQGLQKIQKYFEPNTIDYDACGGFEILNDDKILYRLKEVNHKLESVTGAKETFNIANEKIETFGLARSKYLIENPFEGGLHSGKLINELIKKCHQLNIEFLNGVSIKNINEEKNYIKLETDLNVDLLCDELITCTNAFSHQLIKNENIVPARGQILLTKPIENLKLKGTFHYDEGFYYFRNLGNRVLLGGARNQNFDTEETTSFDTTEFLQNYLENFLANIILPNQKFEIEMRWSGIMAMGKDKTPIIKKLSTRHICAVRLSGMGVALAPIIGEKICEMLSF